MNYDVNYTHPSSVNVESFRDALFELETTFRFVKKTPENYTPKGGNMIAKDKAGQPLSFDRPVVIFCGRADCLHA